MAETGDGRVTCQLCGYRPLQTNLAIQGHLVRHRLNEKFDFFVQLHLQIKDDNYSLERILENNLCNLTNNIRLEHGKSFNTTETQTDSSDETLNDEYDTESNDEIEERIAVQDHDSSLYYSTQDSQRKSPNTNQKNPPRNKIKTLDFGVQYSYSPGTECKKVQTYFSCSDQEAQTSQTTNSVQVNGSSQTNARLELMTKSVQTSYSRVQQSTQTEQISFLTEATTQYETDEATSTRPNSPVLTDEISDDDIFYNSECESIVSQPNNIINYPSANQQGEQFISAYMSYLNTKGSNDDILEEELSSDYSYNSPPCKRFNLNLSDTNYKFVVRRKSKDLIESIEEAPESSKASDVDISESIEDIQQYITATAKKDEKQESKEGFLQSLDLKKKSPVKNLKRTSSLDKYAKLRTPKVRVNIKKLFFPTLTTVFIDDQDGINHCKDIDRQKIVAAEKTKNAAIEKMNVDEDFIIITDSESGEEEQEISVDVPEPSNTRKDYQCVICNKKFSSKGHTQSHIITAHKELTPADVKECFNQLNNDHNNSINDQSKFGRNRKSRKDYSCTLHRKHSCPLCDEVYKYKYQLLVHLTAEHKSKTNSYTCPKCGKHFGVCVTFLNHIVLNHTQDKPQ